MGKMVCALCRKSVSPGYRRATVLDLWCALFDRAWRTQFGLCRDDRCAGMGCLSIRAVFPIRTDATGHRSPLMLNLIPVHAMVLSVNDEGHGRSALRCHTTLAGANAFQHFRGWRRLSCASGGFSLTSGDQSPGRRCGTRSRDLQTFGLGHDGDLACQGCLQQAVMRPTVKAGSAKPKRRD